MTDRRIILCADDFGLSPGVSEGILSLVQLNRLSAVSCMTAGPFWESQAKALKPYAQAVDIGLHITLTDQTALSLHALLAPDGRLPSVGQLLTKCLLSKRRITEEVKGELEAQLDRFVAEMGKLPDFIDGHHHVHQFPVVRNVLINMISDRYCGEASLPYVRICSDSLMRMWARRHSFLKALLLGALSKPLAHQARSAGIPTNSGFSGVYSFSEPEFGRVFDAFLRRLPDLGVIMCHPGFVDEALKALDGVTVQRQIEYDFLASDACLELLKSRSVVLSRYRDRPNTVFTRSTIPTFSR